MPQVHVITSPDDPRLLPYRELKEKYLAREQGLFVAEGEYIVRRLLDSSLTTHSLLVGDFRVDRLIDAVPQGVNVYVASREMLSQVVGYKFHQGVLACGVRPAAQGVQAVMHAKTLVVCPRLYNNENLGLIIRIAAALGCDGLLLDEQGTDLYARRVVRVSMGSVFKLPIAQSDDLHRDLCRLRDEQNMQLVASVLAADATSLDQFHRGDRLALLLGSEPDGLDARTVALCQHKLMIPMHAGVDSLNVAVAAGILLYHLTRRS